MTGARSMEDGANFLQSFLDAYVTLLNKRTRWRRDFMTFATDQQTLAHSPDLGPIWRLKPNLHFVVIVFDVIRE